MVKIVNGNKVNYVPVSAFDNFFKPFGWEIAGEDDSSPEPIVTDTEVSEKPVTVPENDSDDGSDDEWDDVMDELNDEEVEKPISEMNRAELVEKAKKMGIDTSKLNTNKQLREAIKSAM